MKLGPANTFKGGQSVWGRLSPYKSLEEMSDLKVTIMLPKGNIMRRSKGLKRKYSCGDKQRMNIREAIIHPPRELFRVLAAGGE